jgi:hypothetical protein
MVPVSFGGTSHAPSACSGVLRRLFTDRMMKEETDRYGEVVIRPVHFLKYYTVFDWCQIGGLLSRPIASLIAIRSVCPCSTSSRVLRPIMLSPFMIAKVF